jgi:hypothetical protein
MDWAVKYSLVNIPTELQVTAWSTDRPSCRSQPGQQTDRTAGHTLANRPTELQVTTWTTYRPSCTSPYNVRNTDTDSSIDLTHPRHFREGSFEWHLTNVNITLCIQISSKSFDQVRRHCGKYSRNTQYNWRNRTPMFDFVHLDRNLSWFYLFLHINAGKIP